MEKDITIKKERVNDELAAAVNRGIAAMLMSGFEEGFKVMNDQRVPMDVISRVVLGTQFRRSTDWKR